ncbi:MAG: glycogen-binding domain-containing protein [Anaeromyxobacter sp.]
MVRRAASAVGLALALALAGCAGAPSAHIRPTSSPSGPTEFRYEGAAETVTLRGTMTGWRPVSLDRNGSGFTLALPLAPGRYEYRLEVRRGTAVEVWFPDQAERVEDGFGGENAVLRVR